MKYKLDIAPRVSREIAHIYKYREENQGKNAADRFIKALDDCYERILANPNGSRVRKAPFRHIMLHRLKYRVVYKVEDKLVSVVQVRHMSRKPSKKFGP